MFLQNVMIAARPFGLETCPQAAFLNYHEVLQRRLGIPAEQTIVCGMALGYAHSAAPESLLVPDREPLASFVTLAGFE